MFILWLLEYVVSRGDTKKVTSADVLLDLNNRKIIKKLAEGYLSKDLPQMIKLPVSAIDKRKFRFIIFFNKVKQT